MDLPSDVKKLQPGDEYIYPMLDADGYSIIAPWGSVVPPLKLFCERFGLGKKLCWDYSYFGDYIYESCSRGVSTERFDRWLYDATGLRGYCLKYLLSNPDKYKKLNEDRMEYNRNSVKMIQDLDNAPDRYDQVELKMMELRQKSRIGVLARLDPEFREKVDQNISGNIAQIIIPKKDDDV